VALAAVSGHGSALAFSLKATPKAWLAALGETQEHSGPFYLVRPTPLRRPPGLFTAIPPAPLLWIHEQDGTILLATTRAALLHAGPPARTEGATHLQRATEGATHLRWQLRPEGWTEAQRSGVADAAVELLTFLRHGRRAASALERAALLHYLRPFLAATRVTVSLGRRGAEVRVRAPVEAGEAARLDPALVGGTAPAALLALDCRGVMAWQRAVVDAWRAEGGAGVGELGRLLDAEEAAVTECGFAVRTAGEVWTDEASYRLRPGAALAEPLSAAVRAGGLPSLWNALDGRLTVARTLFSPHDGVLAIDRVLGEMGSARTRHAAAFHGGVVLRDRIAIQADRLLTVSGAHAEERLHELLQGGARDLPPELRQALGVGRGRRGYLFADLAALWAPYLKAAQVVSSPLAELVARTPGLLQRSRPLVATLDDELVVTMPLETVSFLLAVAGGLFGL
jgi:hypothetical protein